MKTPNAVGAVFHWQRMLLLGMLCHSTTRCREAVKDVREMQRVPKLFQAEPDGQFELFWKAFPRRVSKQAAMKAWAALKPTPELVDTILQALAWQVLQPAWTKDGGTFVPYPASWLNGRRWEDEPFHAPSEPQYRLSVAEEARRLSRLTPMEQARRLGLKP